MGAALTRPEVRVGTLAPPAAPDPAGGGGGGNHSAVSFAQGNTKFSPNLLFHAEWAKGIKKLRNLFDTLTLKSSFKMPDTSL